jgi:hypothetical protein
MPETLGTSSPPPSIMGLFFSLLSTKTLPCIGDDVLNFIAHVSKDSSSTMSFGELDNSNSDKL